MQQKNILFVGVDPDDRKKVTGTFRNASIEEGIPSARELRKKHPDTEVLCVPHNAPVDRKLLGKLKSLKLVVTRSVGYNHIDVETAVQKNVQVCNVPDYGAHVIAEHVFALLLSMARNVREADEHVEHYKYSDKDFRGMALKGKTLGIVGVGTIGEHVARIASMGFLMRVIAFDPHKDESTALENHFTYAKNLEEIWEKSDVISLHVPLNKHTEHLVDAKAMQQMKKGVFLINTSRGGVIDSAALLKALKSGKIAHAGLDVLEDEDHVKKYKELIDLSQVVTTPHIAYYADDSIHRMYSEAIGSIQRFLEGEKLEHEVTPH